MTSEERLVLAESIPGFMPVDEGRLLYDLARSFPPGATLLEIGAWCGRSSVFLGAGAAESGGVVFSLDHHHGSEENQEGWEYFDPDLVDPFDGRLNTLPHWQRTIARAQLEEVVVGVVGESTLVGSRLALSFDLVFIDGGHGSDPAWADYRTWASRVKPGGLLALHDVFENPAEGGRPPYEIFLFAQRDGFTPRHHCGSLQVLEREV
ncbi:MAG: class I SAM-dependent methyltransferase [Acidimicrobiaceae bacterium]|nr:class I SAM-dependent methyltransferase [Acidimicrobiaceae bacterium]